MFPHRSNRLSYESSPIMVADNGTPLQQPHSAGLYIENIPPAGQQSVPPTDDHRQYPAGLSHNGTSMSCNHSINVGYPSNMSNGGNSISNMGMCFQGQMHHVPSLNFVPNSMQHTMPPESMLRLLRTHRTAACRMPSVLIATRRHYPSERSIHSPLSRPSKCL